MTLSIALVLKGYPRLSETFIAQEIKALEEKGLDIMLISLRHPTDRTQHPIHDEIKAEVLYLPEYLHQEPVRCLKGLFNSLHKEGFKQALKLWLKDLRRDLSRNRVRRFGQALVLAHELPGHINHLYAHFIHTPGSVTRYTATINGLPWSASAHAKDIWTIPQWEIREKLQHLEWLATCTRSNADYLRNLADDPLKVDLVYHGSDFSRFPAGQFQTRQDSTETKIISVGRAVPKKGYDILLEALSLLPGELQWQFTHIGGGTELNKLESRARELQIDHRIQWLGPMAQEQVLQEYRQNDIFVLPSQIVGDGDRDGLPNVLMEAQSQRLCCISTNISGIPELIENGSTGILVEQKNPSQLAAALDRMIRDPVKRQRMADAGYARVQSEFSMEKGIAKLMNRFTAGEKMQ